MRVLIAASSRSRRRTSARRSAAKRFTLDQTLGADTTEQFRRPTGRQSAGCAARDELPQHRIACTRPVSATRSGRRNGQPATETHLTDPRCAPPAAHNDAAPRSPSTTHRCRRSSPPSANPAAALSRRAWVARPRRTHPRRPAPGITACPAHQQTQSPNDVPLPASPPTPTAVASARDPLSPRDARSLVRRHRSRLPMFRLVRVNPDDRRHGSPPTQRVNATTGTPDESAARLFRATP
jgi:hypothetical protein